VSSAENVDNYIYSMSRPTTKTNFLFYFLKKKKNPTTNSLFYFLKKKKKSYTCRLLVIFTRRKKVLFFFSLGILQGEFFWTFQIKDISLAVKKHPKSFFQDFWVANSSISSVKSRFLSSSDSKHITDTAASLGWLINCCS